MSTSTAKNLAALTMSSPLPLEHRFGGALTVLYIEAGREGRALRGASMWGTWSGVKSLASRARRGELSRAEPRPDKRHAPAHAAPADGPDRRVRVVVLRISRPRLR